MPRDAMEPLLTLRHLTYIWIEDPPEDLDNHTETNGSGLASS
jgi:hypothetical protein